MRQSQNWNGSRSAFESEPAYGWPAWRDMRPLLLRSAGVVGLAGMVVAVISNDALMGTTATRAPAPAVWQEPSEPELPVAAIIDPAELRASGDPVAYADGAEIERFDPAARRPAMQVAPLVFSAEPIVGRLERTVFAPPPRKEKQPLDEAPLQTASIASVAPLVERPAAPVGEAELAPANADLQADASLWAQAAVECPRDWLAVGGAASGHCETIVALLPSATSPDVQAALSEAAEEHAMALGPRLPRARPEPPPNAIKKVSTRRRASDWPSTPPPDCGTLHAYWRFVDRKTGAKEWYCK